MNQPLEFWNILVCSLFSFIFSIDLTDFRDLSTNSEAVRKFQRQNGQQGRIFAGQSVCLSAENHQRIAHGFGWAEYFFSSFLEIKLIMKENSPTDNLFCREINAFVVFETANLAILPSLDPIGFQETRRMGRNCSTATAIRCSSWMWTMWRTSTFTQSILSPPRSPKWVLAGQ